MMRIQRLTLAGVVMLLGMLAVGAASASARTGYENTCPSLNTAFCTAESTGQPGDDEKIPVSVAVDNSTGPSAGHVWVSYFGGSLQEFDASGNRQLEVVVGRYGSGSKMVAVDPTSGDVYVATSGGVAKLNASGEFQSEITATPQGQIEAQGLAVDAGGNLYVADSKQQAIEKFSSSGVYIEQFSAPVGYYSGLAVGPEGNIYISANSSVKEYGQGGTPVTCPGGKDSLPSANPASNAAVTVDPSDGHIFVGEESAVEGPFIAEYTSLCASEPSATLARKELGYPTHGIGVSATHQVYAIETKLADGAGTVNIGRIYGVVTVPTVTTSTPASNVTRTSATVGGIVNPEGSEVTTCEFEYGPTAAYGQTAPCSPFPEPPFTGPNPVTVSAELTFLLPPGSAIHYRLKAGGPAGVEYGADEAFTRAAPPTVVSGLPATTVSQFAATLNGTLETGEELANYHFEYGTTAAYGQIAPIPDSYAPITNEPIAAAQPILGLQAGTTYHYRLIASSPGGTNVASPDETFTTLPVPAPTVATGVAEGVGVATATLNGTIDPHGWDTTYLFEYGTSTVYGQSWPTVQVDMGALEGPQPVVVNVPGLLLGTTYHYRLVAINGGGTTYGPDITFTTGEYPASIIQETPLIGLPKTTTTKTTTTKTLTKAQKLTKALKACHKQDKKNKGKRQKCEKVAEKKFGPVKKSKKKK